MSAKYIFYLGTSENIILNKKDLDKDYRLLIWRPGLFKISPRGSNRRFRLICLVWWLFHYFRIFSSSNYGIFVIYHNKTQEMAHYSVVSPKYFRNPFMDKNDIQIGPIGTGENHRRKGLANFAIEKIIEFYKNENIRFWYLVREENEPSIKCIENFGFTKYGEGRKMGRLKKYIIEKAY